MPAIRQHIVREAQDIKTIAMLYECSEEAIQDEPKNADLWQKRDGDGNVTETAYWVVAGDVVYVPDRPLRKGEIELLKNNWYTGKADLRTAYIKVLGAPDTDDQGKETPGAPAPVGTTYRLTIGGRVWVGELDQEGMIVREAIAAGSKVTVEWLELPKVEYVMPAAPGAGGNPSTEELSSSRGDVLKPGSMADMLEEALGDVDPDDIDDRCEDRFIDDAATRLTTDHPFHYLASMVHELLGSRADAWVATTDPEAPWDNTTFALHPLLAHRFPVPQRMQKHTEKAFRHMARPPLIPDKADANRWNATAGASAPWYNRWGRKIHLLGSKDPPLSRDEKNYKEFADLASAANKRLVRLWMGELKHLVKSRENPWLAEWFGTDAGRAHFKNWCQLLVRISQWQDDPESAHRHGRAIDIDYLFNPWAPLFTEGTNRMGGETKTDVESVNQACERVYDRALRLFVPRKSSGLDEQASELARRYYRNNWDWDPSQLHEIYCGYQALNWSLVCYFDLRFGRAAVPKGDGQGKDPAGWRNVNCDPKESKWTKRPEYLVFDRLHENVVANRLPPDAALVFEAGQPVVLDPSLEASGLFRRQTLTYADGHKVDVLIGSLADLKKVDKLHPLSQSINTTLARQIELDHTRMASRIGRDPCRGIFNLSYDVVMAFGRMLGDERDHDHLRMFSFGKGLRANGGDFMHLDFFEDKRYVEYLDVRIDGVSRNDWKLKERTRSPPLTVVLCKDNAGGTQDVSNEAEVKTSNPGVCDVHVDDRGKRVLTGGSEGQCEITATYGDLAVTLSVTVEPIAPAKGP